MFCSFRTKRKITDKDTFQNKTQTILMITGGEKWHYLAVKSLSRELRKITSNHNADYYCMNCLYLFRAESKLKSRKRVCKDYDYCHLIIPKKNNSILKYNHNKKYLKTPLLSMQT